jgi:phosphoribosyl 1,2-cyclic phosphodiesterase
MRAIILGSGSKGNSTLLIGKNKKILIDVGFSYPKMLKDLQEFDVKPSDIDAILITHTHSDHIGGLSTFVKKNNISVYTNSIMEPELLKIVPYEMINIMDDEYNIGEFNITCIHTSHDAIGSVGFLINDDNGSLVYITDTGYINKTYLKKIINKDVYILESNHDINMLMTGPYPYILKQRVVSDKGHLSNEQAGEYLKEIIGKKTKKIILAHLSEINNTPDVALKTVKSILNNNSVSIFAASQNESFDVGEI